MALGPTRQREFADFWPAELGEIPGFLAVSCGLVEGLTAQEIVGELRGDHAGLRGVIESLHRAATAAVEVPSEVEQKKALRAPRVCDPTWSASRAHYPLHMRAFLGLVEWQSKLAAAWPFAFARFMSKIPQQMGSDEFAALVTGIDRSSEEVGATFGWEAAETSAILAQGQGRLASLFETECPDLHRQWNIALRGSGVDVNQLVQRYVVDSLNREFQMLLGRILARAMSSEGIGTEQASIRWQVGGAVAEAPETV
jgi:hypothetical protein